MSTAVQGCCCPDFDVITCGYFLIQGSTVFLTTVRSGDNPSKNLTRHAHTRRGEVTSTLRRMLLKKPTVSNQAEPSAASALGSRLAAVLNYQPLSQAIAAHIEAKVIFEK
jgi:hypothetical protein